MHARTSGLFSISKKVLSHVRNKIVSQFRVQSWSLILESEWKTEMGFVSLIVEGVFILALDLVSLFGEDSNNGGFLSDEGKLVGSGFSMLVVHSDEVTMIGVKGFTTLSINDNFIDDTLS